MGHGLTMDIAKGLSIHEHAYYACIAHLDERLLNKKEKEKVHLETGVFDAGYNAEIGSAAAPLFGAGQTLERLVRKL